MDTDRLGNCTHEHKSDTDRWEKQTTSRCMPTSKPLQGRSPANEESPQNTWRREQTDIETHGRSPANEESPYNSHPLRATSTSLWTSTVHADISLPARALAETLAQQEEKTHRSTTRHMTESREAPRRRALNMVAKPVGPASGYRREPTVGYRRRGFARAHDSGCGYRRTRPRCRNSDSADLVLRPTPSVVLR